MWNALRGTVKDDIKKNVIKSFLWAGLQALLILLGIAICMFVMGL